VTDALRITGKTKIMFMLGDPVAHIVGSALFNDHFRTHGIDAAVSPLHVAPGDLAQVVGTIRLLRNVAGFGVTIPHKIAVLPLLDHRSVRAEHVGAVNFVRREADGRLTGDNVDGIGFVSGLLRNGVTVAGARVLQAGAGGAGRAVAFALAEAGAASLNIVNRSADKAASLAAAVQAAYPDCRCQAGAISAADADIVVNTTSVGMKPGDPLPLDLAGLKPPTTVAEVIMTPEITPILARAVEQRCAIVRGREMLLDQIVSVCRFMAL
jgi:shikimate dehydrogenase